MTPAATPIQFASNRNGERLDRDTVIRSLTEAHVQEVYRALGADRFLPDGPGNWRISSLFREDERPSLAIHKLDGTWLDRATQDSGSIFDAVMRVQGASFPDAIAFVAGIARTAPEPAREQPLPRQIRGKIVATYDYHDADGNVEYQVVRREPKAFSQRRPDGRGGYIHNIESVERVPYRLPRLLQSHPTQPVFIFEGEKDVDRAVSEGHIATCNSGGAGKWELTFSQYFVGREVIIVPDNDKPGRDHAEQVAASVAPVAQSVKVVTLPGLADKGDVSDWLNDGGSFDRLFSLADDTREWTPANPTNGATGEGPSLVLTRMSDVVAKPVDWLWRGWLPRGKLVILGGHPGDGKSTMLAALAATLSTGRMWPDGTQAHIGNSLFMLAEDAFDDTLRPRLDQHDADADRVFGVESAVDGSGKHEAFSISKHLHQLEKAIIENSIDLLVIDPLTSFLTGSDRNAEGDVRDLLTPLGQLADRTGVVVVWIMHVGKPTGSNRRPIQQLLGATAFGAIARSVWMIAPLPGNDATRRLLAVAKSNLALKPPALEWSRPEDQPIQWHGESAHELDNVLSGATRRKVDDAEGFLRDVLNDGPVLSNDIDAQAVTAGVSKAAIRRAKDIIGAQAKKIGSGEGARWYMMLPDTDWEAFRTHQTYATTRQTSGQSHDSEDAQPLDAHVEHLRNAATESSQFPRTDAKMLTTDDDEHLRRTPEGAHREHLRDEHLRNRPEEAPVVITARPSNRCIDCDQPCGTALRCSPCAVKLVRRRA